MAQITKFNIAQIRADVEAALKTVYAKHGVDVTVGRITYNDSSFRCKIEGIVRNTNGVVPVTPKAAALSKFAYLLGKDFSEDNTYRSPSLGLVKITGYNAKAIKYTVIMKQLTTGKSYKVTLSAAKVAVSQGEVA